MLKFFIAGMLLIAPSVALADLKAEIAKCAASPTTLKRLACFDDLTRSIGIEIQSQYSPSNKKTASSDKAPSTPVDGKQAGRLQLIQELIQKGVFSKVLRRGNVSQAWITPSFGMLDFDVKSKFAGLVWEYYLQDSNGSADVALLYDSKTGKQVGSFGRMGLRLH